MKETCQITEHNLHLTVLICTNCYWFAHYTLEKGQCNVDVKSKTIADNHYHHNKSESKSLLS